VGSRFFNTEQIYAFGHSGGGAQTAILGSCGNSELYNDYLSALGAKTDYRDDIAGAMYTPMYYLLGNSTYYAGGGKGSSSVAQHWRIRTGIKQGDTSLCTEINLALALRAYGIEDVDFETIWGQGHTQAEDSGDATDNFIEWVQQCVAASIASGISNVRTQTTAKDIYYDLNGRMVRNPTKGLYIHNGKKVVMR